MAMLSDRNTALGTVRTVNEEAMRGVLDAKAGLEDSGLRPRRIVTI
jgi:hypothetical protein